jgi:effector-binding domain-containing protein
MIEQPFRNIRGSQRYVAIAAAVTMDEFDVVGPLTGEVYEWLAQKGVVPSGPSFVRIWTSDMTAKLDIEVGVPVEAPPNGDERVIVGSIPSGSYVTLFYTVEEEGDHIQANVEIQAWAANRGLEWQIDRSSGVDVWGGRFTFERPDKSSDGNQVFELTYQIIDKPADIRVSTE